MSVMITCRRAVFRCTSLANVSGAARRFDASMPTQQQPQLGHADNSHMLTQHTAVYEDTLRIAARLELSELIFHVHIRLLIC